MKAKPSYNPQPKEVSITLPSGVIAGKWWGPKHIRPILCLHGWQDNAGTFDTLIPLLPKHVSYLAIDLPGHGFSYGHPFGVVYNFHDLAFLVRLIADLYKWKKVSFLAHSMGVFAAFIYAGLFPQEVDLVISLDAIQPSCKYSDSLSVVMKRYIEGYVKFGQGVGSAKSPPLYSYDEIVQKTIEGSSNSVTKETASFLLKRGMAQSISNPNKYYFTRDVAVKYALVRPTNLDYCKYLVTQMKMPYLYIKATDSPYYDEKEFHDVTLEQFQKSNPNFEFHTIAGNHHVHLTNPERVNVLISDIITRVRPVHSEIEAANNNYDINCKL